LAYKLAIDVQISCSGSLLDRQGFTPKQRGTGT